jgi:hypothetical protein
MRVRTHEDGPGHTLFQISTGYAAGLEVNMNIKDTFVISPFADIGSSYHRSGWDIIAGVNLGVILSKGG